MTIAEIYDYADKIGILTFSTIHNGEVHSRSAHFNGYDDEGIYFRTMSNKPYGRQLLETGKLTVCGCSDPRVLSHDENGSPNFPQSYTIRIIGEVKKVSPETIIERAKTNEALKTAAQDIVKYPAMAEGNFMIYKAKFEVFSVDFEKKDSEYKVTRHRDSFGGATFNQTGPRITDKCIECGKCKKTCSFLAIEEGSPYRVNPVHCDDCGSCIKACPVNAIEESLVF